jgi:hypothetical protein
VSLGVHALVGERPGRVMMLVIVAVFAIVYGAIVLALRVPEALALVGAVRRRL